MEGSHALEKALRMEWDLGFENLPTIVRATVLELITKVTERTTVERKGLFVLVKRAGTRLPNFKIPDEFSKPDSSLKKCAGF